MRTFVDQNGQAHTIRCSRCRKVCRSMTGWNMVAAAGVVTGFLCPACQTPEENAEAEVHESTLEYRRTADGRIAGRSKV